jgi:hypothetical protein
MGIPIRQGRSFAPGDLRGVAGVVLSESVARALFGDGEAIGRRIRRVDNLRARATLFQVIGVVGDVPGARIEDGRAPMVYFPLLRDADGVHDDSLTIPYIPRTVQYVVRSTAPPSAQALGDAPRDNASVTMGVQQASRWSTPPRQATSAIVMGVSGRRRSCWGGRCVQRRRTPQRRERSSASGLRWRRPAGWPSWSCVKAR